MYRFLPMFGMWRLMIVLVIFSSTRVYCQEACDPNPCPGGGICTVSGDTYTCDCPDTFDEISPLKCQVYRSCFHNHTQLCSPVSCTYSSTFYQCDCRYQSQENVCETYMLGQCTTNNPCLAGYNCIETSSNYNSVRCSCPGGFLGENCEIYNVCYSNPCPQRSTCTWYINPDRYTCSCPVGYSGDTCTNETHCIINPCSTGEICKLYSDPYTYTCTCPVGYSGDNCSNYEVCMSNPCSTGYTCTSYTNPDRYTCTCPTGYSGDDCSNYEGCMSNPCSIRYICTSYTNPDRYTCTCPTGYSGDDCSNYEGCMSNPCPTGYICTPYTNPDIYICTCPTGYSGSSCDLYKGCMSNPCPTGYICTSYTNPDIYICTCPDGYSGDDCSNYEDACNDSPCYNNGGCQTENGVAVCLCEGVFTGELCQDIHVCDNNICDEGGVCLNNGKEHICYYSGTSVPVYFIAVIAVSAATNIIAAVYFAYKRCNKRKRTMTGSDSMNMAVKEDVGEYDNVIVNTMEKRAGTDVYNRTLPQTAERSTNMEIKAQPVAGMPYEVPHTYMSIEAAYTNMKK